MCDGNQARLWAKQPFVLIEKNLAGVIDRCNAKPRALFRAEHLPRHDVGVMFEPSDDDLIVLLNISPTPALRYKIDGFGCSADKDDFAGGSSIEEAARLLACRLVSVRSARGQLMRGAMHIRVFVLVEITDSVNNRLRLLRRRSVVKPDERTAVDDFAQDGKVAANGLYIERVGRKAEIAGQLGLPGSRSNDRHSIERVEWPGLACGVV